MEAEKKVYGGFIEWYKESYPEQWGRMKKILERKATSNSPHTMKDNKQS